MWKEPPEPLLEKIADTLFSESDRWEGNNMREVQGYPLPLGVQISENKINFSIAVPTEKKCQLLIYRAGRKRLYRQFEMETAVGEVRCIALTDIEPAEYEYNYLINGEVVVDPYVQALRLRSTGVHSITWIRILPTI